MGHSKTARLVSDSFGNKLQAAVIAPGHKILVMPGEAWMDVSDLQSYSENRHFEALERAVQRYLAATQVTIAIDSVIMSDGEVDGPDSTHLANELTGRKQAAQIVVAAADAAKGTDLSIALAQMLSPPRIARDDYVGMWKQRYARNAINIPSYVDDQLRSLPKVPTFWRAN
jgi:hypothetical protein